MRSRDPLLYEQYIGQYLSDEELQVLGSCKLEASCPLSGVLLDSYQEQVIQRRLQIQQEQEEACGEEDEEDDSDVDEAEGQFSVWEGDLYVGATIPARPHWERAGCTLLELEAWFLGTEGR